LNYLNLKMGRNHSKRRGDKNIHAYCPTQVVLDSSKNPCHVRPIDSQETHNWQVRKAKIDRPATKRTTARLSMTEQFPSAITGGIGILKFNGDTKIEQYRNECLGSFSGIPYDARMWVKSSEVPNSNTWHWPPQLFLCRARIRQETNTLQKDGGISPLEENPLDGCSRTLQYIPMPGGPRPSETV
jgi:hypothetical protein